MKRGYIINPVNGRLISIYDKTFFIEYLPDTHPFVKGKFGCVHYSGYCRQIWINKDLLEKYGSWFEPYIGGHERAHIYWYAWWHRKVQQETNTKEYFDYIDQGMRKTHPDLVGRIKATHMAVTQP